MLTRQEERVMLVSCGVLLRLEKGVEIPEGALDEIVCGHFCESTTNKFEIKV